ncbi:MAG: hypothetical protein M3Z04_21860 [Chloroflexota bacterium]|nr:hypothetical protein [Chloroflexota bacterium]
MDRIITAMFDGRVFQPDTPLDLPPNTRYSLTIQPAPESVSELAIDAPPDWSIAHDHYIYGTADPAAENRDTPPDWSIAHDHYIHDIPKREADDNEP